MTSSVAPSANSTDTSSRAKLDPYADGARRARAMGRGRPKCTRSAASRAAVRSLVAIVPTMLLDRLDVKTLGLAVVQIDDAGVRTWRFPESAPAHRREA